MDVDRGPKVETPNGVANKTSDTQFIQPRRSVLPSQNANSGERSELGSRLFVHSFLRPSNEWFPSKAKFEKSRAQGQARSDEPKSDV